MRALQLPRTGALVALLVAAGLAGGARAVTAAEATVFLSSADPGDAWKTGYGGALTITLFNIVGGEIEGFRQGSERPDTSLFSLSGKAYIAPPFGTFVPYGGIGIGVYRESVPAGSDTGSLGLVFVGAKLKFPIGLVVRGEYQWVDMPMAAPVDLDHRYFVGVGLSF
jgi:hypothetical protein